MKSKLKQSNVIRENYRRLRKIFLHIIHGRFYSALKLANHYNPVFRLIIKTPLYMPYRQKKSLAEVLTRVYSYQSFNNNKKYKVVLIFRDGDHLPTSSAFIRLIGPLSDKSIAGQVQLNICSAQKMPKRVDADFFIVQRTAFNDVRQAKRLVSLAKTTNSIIIVDNDDAFHAISKTHPEYYKQIKRVKAVEYLLDQSAQIWVSTEALVDRKYSSKTKVIPNGLDKRLWQAKPMPYIKSTSPTSMVYMGTATHNADFEMIVPALDEINEKYPGSFSLTIIGVSQDLPDRSWITRITTPRFGSLYPAFVEWFLAQGPFDIGLSPLVDSPFNRSKSDIKCLDYLAVGIVPVVSDILPYQSKELKNFIIKIKNDKAAWSEQLSKIVSDPEKFRLEKTKIIPKAQKYIWQSRTSSKTAAILLERLDNLARSK